METVFTPLQSLAGGILIGVASVLLMAFLGRIMGATGILAGALQPSDRADVPWRVALILGMISGPILIKLATGSFPVIRIKY